jgi:hypothetical protein
MDETQTTAGASWWEDTLDFVVRAAATKRFASPQLQSGLSYYIDASGNAVPMGQPLPGQYPMQGAQLLNSPVVMLAGLALAAVLLYKLVK